MVKLHRLTVVYIDTNDSGNHCYIGGNDNGYLRHIGGDGGSCCISSGSNKDLHIGGDDDNNNDDKWGIVINSEEIDEMGDSNK